MIVECAYITNGKNMDEELEKLKKERMKRLIKKMEMIKISIEANDKDFQEKVVEQSKKIPVVADFWAEWCMPCRMLGPVLEKIAKEYEGKFILAKINVNEAQLTAETEGVRGIPAVKFFKDGKIVDEFLGVLPEDEIKKWLDKNLGE